MFFSKKNKEPEKRPFDRIAFENLVEMLQNNADGLYKKNEIPIKYKYMGVQYSIMLYKYKLDSNNNIISVHFSLPQVAENRTLSCYIVSVARTLEDAIETLKNFTANKYR